jgi:outer membrane protein assembly factor BamB
MKRLLGAGLALALLTTATAQERRDLYSVPVPPPREVLERLHLRQAWQTAVPMDGRRDGIHSIYVTNNQVLVQTRSGLVALIDGDSGRILWRTAVGKPYQNTQPLSFNGINVFVVNAGIIYGLDRETGAIAWQYTLPVALTTTPVADAEQIYLTAGGRVFAFRLPRADLEGVPLRQRGGPPGQPGADRPGYEPPGAPADPYAPSAASVRPVPLWIAPIPFAVDYPPLVGSDAVVVSGPDGSVLALSRIGVGDRGAGELFRFATDGPLSAPPGSYGNIAYLGSRDGNLYALSMQSGRLAWRYTAGTPISRRPVAIEKDVYVVAEGLGLARVDRATGEPLWRLPRGRALVPANAEADRFLAANPKFVYALDRAGRLLILERARGQTLGSLDVHDFVVPVVNDQNDRLFLAANNGLIVCLHDRDYPAPYFHLAQEPRGPGAPRPSLDPKQREQLQKRLQAPVTFDMEGQPMPIRTLLSDWERRYQLRFSIAERAYRERGNLAVLEKAVTVPKVANVPLGDVLKQVLAQVDSDFIVFDEILIFPAGKPKPPEKLPEKPPGKP